VRNWRHKVCFASCLFVWASLAAPAFAQEQVSLHPASLRTKEEAAPAPKPKPKKVWTEDSIAEVRTPADNYLDSKASTPTSAQTTPNGAASTAANSAGPKGLGAPPVVLHIPKTAEETQQAIDQRKGMADNFHNLLSNAQERLQTETDPTVRATLTQKANLLLSDISLTNSEIKALEKALDDYKNGKTPAQPKTEGQSSTAAAKPTVQTAASTTPQ
jgi:hypothetical protein